MKNLLYLITVALLSQNLKAEGYIAPGKNYGVQDGPFIFRDDDQLRLMWIRNGILKEGTINQGNFKKYSKKFGLSFGYNDLFQAYTDENRYDQSFMGVDSLAVLADVHGAYDVYIKSLRNTGIIDKDLDWNFGKGHLIILGDVFDRGDKVTEILWHLFGLEKQAAKAGGMVHLLLGNHELMVLTGNIAYANQKYLDAASIMGMSYSGLFSGRFVLGHWLRSKPIMITINDALFVHGGISAEIARLKLSVEQVNYISSRNLITASNEKVHNDTELRLLENRSGPLWYRGYFTDSTFCETRLDSILSFYGCNHIVVGHTPHKAITVLFDSKILGTDTGIMYGKPGEILMYKENAFYRAYPDGRRIIIN